MRISTCTGVTDPYVPIFAKTGVSTRSIETVFHLSVTVVCLRCTFVYVWNDKQYSLCTRKTAVTEQHSEVCVQGVYMWVWLVNTHHIWWPIQNLFFLHSMFLYAPWRLIYSFPELGMLFWTCCTGLDKNDKYCCGGTTRCMQIEVLTDALFAVANEAHAALTHSLHTLHTLARTRDVVTRVS